MELPQLLGARGSVSGGLFVAVTHASRSLARALWRNWYRRTPLLLILDHEGAIVFASTLPSERRGRLALNRILSLLVRAYSES